MDLTIFTGAYRWKPIQFGRGPLAQGVVHGDAKQTLRQMPVAATGPQSVCSGGRVLLTELRAVPTPTQFLLNPVEVLNPPQDPAGHARGLIARFEKFPAGGAQQPVRFTWPMPWVAKIPRAAEPSQFSHLTISSKMAWNDLGYAMPFLAGLNGGATGDAS